MLSHNVEILHGLSYLILPKICELDGIILIVIMSSLLDEKLGPRKVKRLDHDELE